MFYFVLGFGIGFYVCYLALKIKKFKADKNTKVDIVAEDKSKVTEKSNKKNEVK